MITYSLSGYKMMTLLPDVFTKRPQGSETDYVGIIVDSNNVPSLHTGERVYGKIAGMVPTTVPGSLSEYVVVGPGETTRCPPSLTVEEAAGYALVGLTAYVALFEVCGIQPGQSVFVNGGSHFHVYCRASECIQLRGMI
jgi:NADPH:quinone reductase-like Zn-dependent oxidoreductase